MKHCICVCLSVISSARWGVLTYDFRKGSVVEGSLLESPSSWHNRKNNLVKAPESVFTETPQSRMEGFIPATAVFPGHTAALALEVLFRVTAVTAGRYNPLMNRQLLPPALVKTMISGWGCCCLESSYSFNPPTSLPQQIVCLCSDHKVMTQFSPPARKS